MKTLEAKPFDQNAEKWKREKRLFSSTVLEAGASRQKIESVRTHSEVIEEFDSFSLLKILFLVRNSHCRSRKAFSRQMTPRAVKKTAKRRFFDTADRYEKLYGQSPLYASTQGRHKTVGALSLFFESFLWHVNKKQRGQVIFRFSKPVLCKKMAQESNDFSTLPLSLVLTIKCRNKWMESHWGLLWAGTNSSRYLRWTLRIFNSRRPRDLYDRFVDDTFALFGNEERSQQFSEVLETLHSALAFVLQSKNGRGRACSA